MAIAFLVLKLEGGQIDPPSGVIGSRNSTGGIGFMQIFLTLQFCLTSNMLFDGAARDELENSVSGHIHQSL